MINPEILAQLNAGQTGAGEMGMQDVQDMRKALEAGYGTDVSTLTGGGALRIQSLDKTMMTTIQENKHFRLFNELAKSNATATVDEWTEQSGVGGFLGGSTNTESGSIEEATGQYARRTGTVKYLMTRRQVSLVQSLQNTIADSEAVEQRNGALQLLTDAEFLCFEGNELVNPTEFSGIAAQIRSLGSDDHVLDAEAQSLASIDLVNKAAATITGYGNFGTPTHLFMSQKTQADFDTGLDPAFRVPLTNVPNGGIMLGAPVNGIRTSWGDVAAAPDVFVRDGEQMKPFEVDFAAIALRNVGLAPASVTLDGTVSAVDSKFGAAHAGNYYYLVTGLNAKGQSTGVISAQVAVAAGKKVSITIAKSVAGEEVGYVIYRSRLNGSNAVNDFRQMVRVARTGASTVYVDLNREIPGTSSAYILNLKAGDSSITWRQMLPMLKFPLYPTVSAVIPWAQLMFGYLRVAKRKHHVLIKNVLPKSATWKPFN